MDGVKPVELQEPLEELARDPTRFTHDLMFPPADKIRVYDDTLRDGEQMPGVAITPENKYELARQLVLDARRECHPRHLLAVAQRVVVHPDAFRGWELQVVRKAARVAREFLQRLLEIDRLEVLRHPG